MPPTPAAEVAVRGLERPQLNRELDDRLAPKDLNPDELRKPPPRNPPRANAPSVTNANMKSAANATASIFKVRDFLFSGPLIFFPISFVSIGRNSYCCS